MIAVLKKSATPKQIEDLEDWFREQGLECQISRGRFQTVMGLIGDVSRVDTELVESLDIVESVKRISEPFKKANRKFHPDDTVISIPVPGKEESIKIGGGNRLLIAGPAAVESEAQILASAEAVKKAGPAILRAGTFPFRTSPYSFQGLREEGIRLLSEAGKAAGLPVATQVTDIRQLALFDSIDVIEVGAANMQNVELLKELGRIRKPVILRRGPAATLEELLMSAEYILSGGNEQVILCECGIRTFDSGIRKTLDISAVPRLHAMTHLPVMVNPSESSGKASLAAPLADAAFAAGADGIGLLVHPDPKKALDGGAASLSADDFIRLSQRLR